MRSRTNCIINSGQVHSWSLGLLVDAKLVKDHGWKCTAAIVWRAIDSGCFYPAPSAMSCPIVPVP